jgi:hypothetical protein
VLLKEVIVSHDVFAPLLTKRQRIWDRESKVLLRGESWVRLPCEVVGTTSKLPVAKPAQQAIDDFRRNKDAN